MADVFSRRNAFLGWLVWNVAKRKLRKKLRPEPRAEGTRPRRAVLRSAAFVAVLATLAAAWAKRSGHHGGDEG